MLDLFGRRLLALGWRGRGRWKTIQVVRVRRHVLRNGTRRNGSYRDVLMRVQGRLPRSCARGLGRDDQRRARRVCRHMLLRHTRWHMGVRVVWLVGILLPALVLLHVLLRVEGRRRAMVEGVGIDLRLRRWDVHMTVVLLLAARLFVVGDWVARAHMVVVIHGGGGEKAGAMSSRRQR
jgi:hypothetical protein